MTILIYPESVDILIPAIKLDRTCIIVSNIAKCREFYKNILEIEPVIDMPSYVEFETLTGGLAFFDSEEQENLAPRVCK